MKTCIKIAFIVVGCLPIVGCTSEYYAIDRYPISKTSEFAPDLKEVNRLAKAGGGELPTEVRSLVVAEASMPKWFAIAGGGCGKIPFDIVAYQVVYPDRTVTIDSCFDKKKARDGIALFLLRTFQMSSYNKDNYKILQESLKTASLILITHEHFDHIGGIAASPYLSEILPQILLSREQVESPEIRKVGFPQGVPEGYRTVPDDQYRQYYRAAPGIVLIKAPGHAPGQQMIYVLTKDGNEYLFLADILWNRENLKRRTYRPYIASMKEDPNPAREEFRWVLYNLYDNPNNKIVYVIAHDRDQLTEYINAGVIKEGFK
jgi:glyoxylase-like metal-dependent hydrolase (beta-lactamase superfamily II)